MSEAQAQHAIHWFGMSYALHPWTFGPLGVITVLLPFLDPNHCSARCARVMARLGHEGGSDIHLIFWLLTLLTLPLGVDLLWRLARRYRLGEALQHQQIDEGLDRPYVRCAFVALCGLVLALYVLYFGPPVDGADGHLSRSLAFMHFVMTAGFWHLALYTIGYGCAAAAAAWTTPRRRRPF